MRGDEQQSGGRSVSSSKPFRHSVIRRVWSFLCGIYEVILCSTRLCISFSENRQERHYRHGFFRAMEWTLGGVNVIAVSSPRDDAADYLPVVAFYLPLCVLLRIHALEFCGTACRFRSR